MLEETDSQTFNLEIYGQNYLDILPLSPDIILNPPYVEDSSSDSITTIKQVKQYINSGRKRARPLKKGEKPHGKDATDNILRKIQVHYLNFIICFMNELLKHSGYTYKLIKIDYNIKKVINKNNILSLKKMNIGEILCLKASPKFSTKDKDNNYIICNKVKENEKVNYFLSQNYMQLFKDVYLNNKRSFKENGIVFELSKKVKTFEDLLNKQKGYDNIDEYKQKMIDVINLHYLNLFVVKDK